MNDLTTSLDFTFTVPFRHRVYFTRSVFAQSNGLLAQLLEPPKPGGETKAILVIDQGIAASDPSLIERITTYFSLQARHAVLVCPPLILPGGESAKHDSAIVDNLYSQIERHGLCRHSYLLALGGGALLDAAGFAAATAHRGIRHIRLPSTTLSQADGGVGVKNGINAFGKKNFLGTFTPPFAVINDSDFLASLPPEEKRAGYIEAIKIALIRDSNFFERIESAVLPLCRFDLDAIEKIINRCAELHVRHIVTSQDPFEFGSARPLDFGHWAAHKLEQMSGFAISHGRAVAIGLSLDTLYSHKKGMLAQDAADRILNLVKRLGFAIYDPLLSKRDAAGNWLLINGLEEFREHLGGDLTVTLLSEIGRGVEVEEIDPALMLKCVGELEKRQIQSEAI